MSQASKGYIARVYRLFSHAAGVSFLHWACSSSLMHCCTACAGTIEASNSMFHKTVHIYYTTVYVSIDDVVFMSRKLIVCLSKELPSNSLPTVLNPLSVLLNQPLDLANTANRAPSPCINFLLAPINTSFVFVGCMYLGAFKHSHHSVVCAHSGMTSI